MARLDRDSIRIDVDYALPHKQRARQEKELLEAAANRARARHSGDAVGEMLRWQRADGYAVYMVTRESPLTLAHVDVCDGYTVEGALIRGLDLATVRRMVEAERKMREYFERADDFYEELEVGQIVHYHDAFGQFVRCEVVVAPDDEACVHAEKGEKCLREIALVGNWKDRDLRSDSYHMRGVREGHLFKPSAGCIYENPEATNARRHGDPSRLAPLGVSGQQELFG